MRAVIQRVLKASVQVEGRIVGRIDKGLLVYLGVAKGDDSSDAKFIARKITELRIFEDDAGKMNRSVCDIGGSVLIISNFTLCSDCRKGRRPSFDNAAEPDVAEQLYEGVVRAVTDCGLTVEKGRFQEHMHIDSINDGPVTFILESD
ncbi:MAG: D-aminoacyl-tRNA deacylase [Phycisphaerales bacterium]|jgi:D-tyrosyl-tRNA(Tyr) deacylase